MAELQLRKALRATELGPPLAHPAPAALAGRPRPVPAVAKPVLHQPPQRLVGVPVLDEVVHQPAQDIVAGQVAGLLGAVPARVLWHRRAMRDRHDRLEPGSVRHAPSSAC